MPATELPTGATYSKQYRRCGKPGCAVCAPGAPGHGPYWYAYWREDGRLRSRYVGKHPPAVAMSATPPPPDPAPSAGSAAALRVRTLGGFAVWRGDELIAVEHWNRSTVAHLFKLLLGAPGHRLHREQIVDVLWPDADPEEGAHRLRSTVHRLRAVLDAPASTTDTSASTTKSRAGTGSYLRSDGDALALAPAPHGNPAPDWLDAMAFARAAQAALSGRDAPACRAALALYGGEYLPEEVYEDWAAVRREELRQQYLALLLHLAELCAVQGEPAEAERSLRMVLAADPCHEAAAQRLMGLLAAEGRHGDALRLYDALATALRADLGLMPSTETESLRSSLLAQQAAPRATDLAPHTTPSTRPHNLPAQVSTFVGRAQELATARDLLTGHRLVTLTGAGGCGKTRLALHVATTTQPSFPDGVWLVELAALPAGETSDPALIVQAVATALGIHEEPGHSLPETLLAFLRPRCLLLILDNCEHVVAACAALVTMLLNAAPTLRVLATSREALRIDGEMAWSVPPLSLPPIAYQPRLEELPRYEAVQLFTQRAQLSKADFALTDANAAAVAQICRRLDGIPLAIELAAARLGVLSVDGLLARLDDCFRLLVGGSRTALPRQQTLRATMEWSYTLLSAPERALLRRLTVFAGGCTLDAAEAVCAGAEVDAAEVLDLLAHLAGKSLVVLTEHAGEARYGLLETVRQFGREHLQAGGEDAAVRTRHLDYYRALAQRAAAEWMGAALRAWLDRLEAEHDNMRAALGWAQESAEIERGLDLCGALWRFWEMHGYVSEGRRVLDALLAAGGTVAAPVRARALNGAGNLAYRQGDYERSTVLLCQSLALWRELGDAPGAAAALNNLGLVADEQGAYDQATAFYEESMALKEALGDKPGLARSLTNLGRVEEHRGNLDRAVALHEQSLAVLRELGDRHSIARSLNNLALAVQRQDDDERAVTLLEESVALKRELGDTSGLALSLDTLGAVAQRQGDDAAALHFYAQSLPLWQSLDDRQGTAGSLEGLAVTCAGLERLVEAAQLFGAAEALRATGGSPRPPAEQGARDAAVATVRARLGNETFTHAWATGRAMPLNQLVAAITEPEHRASMAAQG